MKTLWSIIEKIKLSRNRKIGLYIFGRALISGVIGLLVWIFANNFSGKELAYAVCFVGYPAIFIGFFGGFLYLYKHDFS